MAKRGKPRTRTRDKTRDRLTLPELQLAYDFVEAWRAMHGGRPATKACLVAVMDAFRGNVYTGRFGELFPTEEPGAPPRAARTSRDYAVDLLAEHDGVWVVAHRRGSGRWHRQARRIHPSTVHSERGLSAIEGES